MQGTAFPDTALASDTSWKFWVPRAILTSEQLATDSGPPSGSITETKLESLERLAELRKELTYDYSFTIKDRNQNQPKDNTQDKVWAYPSAVSLFLGTRDPPSIQV